MVGGLALYMHCSRGSPIFSCNIGAGSISIILVLFQTIDYSLAIGYTSEATTMQLVSQTLSLSLSLSMHDTVSQLVVKY
jgi:hypothetical protein